MRRILLPTLLLASLFAGCLDGPGELTGKPALAQANDFASDQLENPYLLGLLAVEGPFDMERAQEMAREEGSDEILDSFDLLVPNGPLGDGSTGSWFTAHAGFSETGVSFLLTQVLESGKINHYREDVGRDDGFAMAQAEAAGALLSLPGLSVLDKTAASETDSCSQAPDWSAMRLDSDEAASIAHTVDLFVEHVDMVPEGEFVYFYAPDYDPCSDAPDGNVWVVAHADLDLLLLHGEVPEIAFVAIDAATGQVVMADVYRPTEWHTLIDSEDQVSGPLLPTVVSGESISKSYTFDTAGALSLSVDVAGHDDGVWTLSGPNGTSHLWRGAHHQQFEDVPSGTWTLEYHRETTSIGESDRLLVYVVGEFLLQ